ncbi:lyase family protein [Mycolicibacterium sp. 120266]|uniref:lyase family protein n=1 Tax=Mycolicibacterium sp. 120266 TaxID=3090601 RepID=UPI00299DA721|nr:lyase family protein [Mycolicibacterium sp. 120266]MDX1876036.1 lyase family protein [Mycolicibacterium sp. 120266]
MSSLTWPGDHHAGALMSDGALLDAMTHAEDRWLYVLTEHGVAPSYRSLRNLLSEDDIAAIATQSESGGNPVIPLVDTLRARLRAAGDEDAARWMHRGLTSQDIMDTALMLTARDAVTSTRSELTAQIRRVSSLADHYRHAPMTARTLTRAAVPTTFGLKAATWLHGLVDAAEALAALTFPVQMGGAAGTLSGVVELAGPARARACRADFPASLGLQPSAPWHTHRAAVTRLADAATCASDAWGRIANDILALGRSEIGELSEGTGGASSTMPHKANPTLSVLIRRAALTAPPLAATLHTAAAEQVDERADGAWHVEWQTLQTLLRRTVVAARQSTALLAGLRVDTAAMSARLVQVDHEVRSEQRSLAALAGHEPAETYLGLVDDLVDEAITRARPYSEEPS